MALLLAILTVGSGAQAEPRQPAQRAEAPDPIQQRAGSYVIVVSQATREHPDWQPVVQALLDKHAVRNPRVVAYEADLAEVLPALREMHPRHTCFVAPHSDVTRTFVAEVHQLTRQYDEDPYTDTFWGILTGYDAANALAIARHHEPLIVDKVGSGTELAMEKVVEGYWYCELVRNRYVHKPPDGQAKMLKGPDDTTKALVNLLNEYQADLFVTSGHATERDWQIGFRYPNGYFRSKAGRLYGEDTENNRHNVHSPNPKVYLPIGNCLMGHIDGPDAMALAWMNSAGVKQMIGYTVPTWFGYAGWGCLDYFVEQPGRYTFTEAFFANQHALIHNIENKIGNQRGMSFDRDVVAFYGDPAWQARMADGPRRYEQELRIEDDLYTFVVTPNRGETSFHPVNTNGSQRGWRPIVHFLPHRIEDVRIIAGQDLAPLITDDFILIPNPRECDPDREYQVVFRARSMEADGRRQRDPTSIER